MKRVGFVCREAEIVELKGSKLSSAESRGPEERFYHVYHVLHSLEAKDSWNLFRKRDFWDGLVGFVSRRWRLQPFPHSSGRFGCLDSISSNVPTSQMADFAALA